MGDDLVNWQDLIIAIAFLSVPIAWGGVLVYATIVDNRNDKALERVRWQLQEDRRLRDAARTHR